MKSVLRLIAAAALGLAPIITSAAPAGAAPIDAAPVGNVVFYEKTDLTGSQTVLSYVSCDKPVEGLLGTVGSFDNRPLDGCRVQLMGPSTFWVTLCEGRATLPPTLRRSPLVRIVPGTAPRCFVVTPPGD